MDGLSAAASVIAVIEISAKIAWLCLQYSVAVKNAEKDIQRLQKKAADINDVLGKVKQLLDGGNKTKLSATHQLADSLKDCFLRLDELKTRLDPGKSRRTMSRFGVRALKWPFTSEEVEKIVVGLERYEQAFILALQVDQTGLMLEFDQKMDLVDKKTDNLHQKIDLAKLPIAKGASFDSHMEEHNGTCLGNTRVELQRHIAEWAKDEKGKPVFWLNGMAGTGKSTIARTVARSFADKGQLGASFFFKKGESDRGNATRFFPTIATDLMVHIPRLIPAVRKAIDVDPAISERSLKHQFEKLILQPLSEIIQTSSQAMELIIVIDALDECDREDDIRAILQLLAQTRNMTPVSLRVFLTSRPELHIRLGFKKMSDATYQDLILHEVPTQTIKRDIAFFLEHELEEIREQRSLSPYWPGKDKIQTLVEMAIPLFIFAATICRYLREERGNPKQRLDTILQYQLAHQVSKLDGTYLPILSQLFDDKDEDEVDKEKRISEFREVVGSIVVLESSFYIFSLSNLLGIPEEDISCRLDSLHSVLSIPVDKDNDMPVRLLHLSFRDFLLDPQKNGKSPFWVDEREAHARLTSKCLQLLSSTKGLREDMCNLSRPGTLRSEIDKRKIDDCLQPEVKYACRYWVHHLQQSKEFIRDGDSVSTFLQKYFLYWLEAMSFIGEASESIRMINSLQLLVDSDSSAETANVLDFLRDAKRFTLRNRSILEDAPLQLYSSALMFAPERSTIRKRFNDHIPSWATLLSNVGSDWNALLLMLEGHSHWVSAVTFSPDDQLVASGSHDSTVRLWDAGTGYCRSTLEGHSATVSAVAFSPHGKLVASGSHDSTVRLWDAATWSCRSTLKGHSDMVTAVAFSPDGQLIASGSHDCTIRLWDATTGSFRSIIESHRGAGVTAVVFSPDGQLVASLSYDSIIQLWDTATESCRSTLKGPSRETSAVAFSPSGHLLAFGLRNFEVWLWDAATWSCHSTLEGRSHLVSAVAFSPDSRLVVSGSLNSTVRLWNTATGSCCSTLKGDSRTLKGDSLGVSAVALSSNGQLVASGSRDCTVRLWDAATGSCRTLKGRSGQVNVVAFSPDGQLIASGSRNSTVRLWDTATGSCRSTLEGHAVDHHSVRAVVFSPDGQLVASASRRTVRLWDTATGSCRSTLECDPDRVSVVAFSPDGQLVATGSRITIQLWDTVTGSCRSTLKCDSFSVRAIAFSPDGQLVASGSAGFTVILWDAVTWSCRSRFESPGSSTALAFSLDGQLIASANVPVEGSGDSTISIWDVATGSFLTTLDGYSNDTSGISALAFSPDGSYLVTDRGLIYLPSSLVDTSSRQELDHLFAFDQWVKSADQRLLWIPPEYRPTTPTCTAVWENFICMANASGHITILEFNLDGFSPQNKPVRRFSVRSYGTKGPRTSRVRCRSSPH